MWFVDSTSTDNWEFTVCTYTWGKKYEIMSSSRVKEMSVSYPLILKLGGASGLNR